MAQKRRNFSRSSARVVLEVLSGERSPAEACRHYQLSNAFLNRWKRQFTTSDALAFGDDSELERERTRIAELERLLGRLTLELDVAKKASWAIS